MTKKIEMGDKVKDLISGFEGIATGRSEWLYGCTRITVTPQDLHEGKPVEAQWFDEEQLEVVARNVITGYRPAEDKPGPAGPRNDPSPARLGE